MAVKIKLRRIGNKNRPFYEVVASNASVARNGMYLEKLGTHDPKTKESNINIEKSLKWIFNGAIPTETANRILSKTGVLFKKHLQVGVRKGAITQEVADKKFDDWMKTKKANA